MRNFDANPAARYKNAVAVPEEWSIIHVLQHIFAQNLLYGLILKRKWKRAQIVYNINSRQSGTI
jgi:hypothetical protein